MEVEDDGEGTGAQNTSCEGSVDATIALHGFHKTPVTACACRQVPAAAVVVVVVVVEEEEEVEVEEAEEVVEEEVEVEDDPVGVGTLD